MAVAPVIVPPEADGAVSALTHSPGATQQSDAQQETWRGVARALSTPSTTADALAAYSAFGNLLQADSLRAPEQTAQEQAAVNQILSGIKLASLAAAAGGDEAAAAVGGDDAASATQLAPGGSGSAASSPDQGSVAFQTGAPSIFNIPRNLIQDIINIPYNFIEGMDLLGKSLIFSGSWWLASSTNVWGTDPGDPAHWEGVTSLFPFPAFSEALAKQIWGLSAVLLPVNSNCHDVGCPDGGQLNAGYMQPARIWELLTTGKYTFDDTPVVYPDGVERPAEGLWNFGGTVDWGGQLGNPHWDTITDPVTGRQMMPWAGTTFELDLLSPLTDYWFDHLLSDPSAPENQIKLPTVQRTVEAVTSLATGLFVAFSPFFPGSWYCFTLCDPMPPEAPYYWDEYPFPSDWPNLINTALTGLTDWLADPLGLNRPPYTPPPFGDEDNFIDEDPEVNDPEGNSLLAAAQSILAGFSQDEADEALPNGEEALVPGEEPEPGEESVPTEVPSVEDTEPEAETPLPAKESEPSEESPVPGEPENPSDGQPDENNEAFEDEGSGKEEESFDTEEEPSAEEVSDANDSEDNDSGAPPTAGTGSTGGKLSKPTGGPGSQDESGDGGSSVRNGGTESKPAAKDDADKGE